MRRHTWVAAAAVVIGSIGSWAGADIVFRDGITNDYVTNYDGTQDTDVFQTVGTSLQDKNYGGITTLNAVNNTASGRRRFILSFDLSSLTGQGLTVQSATLALTKVPAAVVVEGLTAPNVVSALDISAANAGWLQGRGSGTDVLTGESTSIHRAYPDVPWASGSNLGTGAQAALDFNGNTADATGEYWRTDPAGTQGIFNLPASIVQGWIDDPSSNAGLFFSTSSDAVNGVLTSPTVQFASSEHPIAVWRPTLTIVVPEPATAGVLGSAAVMLLVVRRRAAR